MPNAEQKRSEYEPEIMAFLDEKCRLDGTIRMRRLYMLYMEWASSRPIKHRAGVVNFSEIIKRQFHVEGHGNRRVYVGLSER